MRNTNNSLKIKNMGRDYEQTDWNNWSYDENFEDNSAKNDDIIVVKDANGNTLSDGDIVVAIKDLKVKGSKDIKRGDKFAKIRLTDNTELIESGKMVLRTEFFKKI